MPSSLTLLFESLNGALILLDWSLEDGEALQKQFQEVLRIDPKFSSEHVANIYSFKNQANLELVVGSLRKAGLK